MIPWQRHRNLCLRVETGVYDTAPLDLVAEALHSTAEGAMESDEISPLYKCASPRCPGYSYRASEIAHPAETCTG